MTKTYIESQSFAKKMTELPRLALKEFWAKIKWVPLGYLGENVFEFELWTDGAKEL